MNASCKSMLQILTCNIAALLMVWAFAAAPATAGCSSITSCNNTCTDYTLCVVFELDGGGFDECGCATWKAGCCVTCPSGANNCSSDPAPCPCWRSDAEVYSVEINGTTYYNGTSTLPDGNTITIQDCSISIDGSANCP